MHLLFVDLVDNVRASILSVFRFGNGLANQPITTDDGHGRQPSRADRAHRKLWQILFLFIFIKANPINTQIMNTAIRMKCWTVLERFGNGLA